MQYATTVELYNNPMPAYNNVWVLWSLWFPAMGVNVGKPDANGYNGGVRSCGPACATSVLPSPPAPFKTGSSVTCIGNAGVNGCSTSAPAACSHGTTFGDVWRRDFVNTSGQHNIVLLRDYGYGWCTDDFDWSSQIIDLSSANSQCAPNCSYYVLHIDGTQTGPITSIQMSAGSAAILIASTGGSLIFPPPNCPIGFESSSYTCNLSASGGTPPYTWSVSSGSLPPSLTINSSSGTISGTPTVVGTQTPTIKVQDSASGSATQPATIQIEDPVLDIATASCPGGSIGTQYSGCTLTATGGNGRNTWSLASGSLPPGLALNSSTGVITGTPSSGGTYPFVARATDTETPPQVATQSLSISVTSSPLRITSSTCSIGFESSTYRCNLTASGGATPYTWSVISGHLPAGLTLTTSSNVGVISGTPTAIGTFTPTIQVKDSTSGTPQTASAVVSIQIEDPLLHITTTSCPAGVVGTRYSGCTLAAAGGNGSNTWALATGSGPLPPGLSLNPTTGAITGTPTSSGTYPFVAQVTDRETPPQVATKSLSISVTSHH